MERLKTGLYSGAVRKRIKNTQDKLVDMLGSAPALSNMRIVVPANLLKQSAALDGQQ